MGRLIYNLYAQIYNNETSQIKWFRARTRIEEVAGSKLGKGKDDGNYISSVATWRANMRPRDVGAKHACAHASPRWWSNGHATCLCARGCRNSNFFEF